jgi:hypothetical protein
MVGAGCSLMGLDSGGDGGACHAEVCDNGLDDDCNGLTDCADPACMAAGYSCLPTTVPAGAKLVAYNATARPGCPAGYGTATPVIGNVDGGTTCDCTCAGTDGVCTAMASYHAYADGCEKDSGITASGFTATTACRTGSGPSPANVSYDLFNASTPEAGQGVCSATPVALPGPGADLGEICLAPEASDGGCNGNACRLTADAGFRTCVLLSRGLASCPASGFSQQVVVSSGVPGYVDTRSCAGCQCGTTLGCEALDHLALFEGTSSAPNTTCRGNPDFVIDASCGASLKSGTVASYQSVFVTTGSAQCEETQPGAVDGGVTLDTNTETLCCLP